MDKEVILSWNFENWLTIVLMVAIMFAALRAITLLVTTYSGKNSAATPAAN